MNYGVFIGLVLILTFAFGMIFKKEKVGKLPDTPEEHEYHELTKPWEYKPKTKVNTDGYNYTKEYDINEERWKVTLTELGVTVTAYVYKYDIIHFGSTLKNALESLLPKMRQTCKDAAEEPYARNGTVVVYDEYGATRTMVIDNIERS